MKTRATTPVAPVVVSNIDKTRSNKNFVFFTDLSKEPLLIPALVTKLHFHGKKSQLVFHVRCHTTGQKLSRRPNVKYLRKSWKYQIILVYATLVNLWPFSKISCINSGILLKRETTLIKKQMCDELHMNLPTPFMLGSKISINYSC